MDNLNSHPQQSSSQSSTKNVKNLSIKEFFTTRLMRAKSFEGGASSPKDETLNWFDEFKARMTKKSQANSGKHASHNSAVEESNDESTDSCETNVRSTNHARTRIQHIKEDSSSSLVKNLCDNNLNKLIESSENTSEIASFDLKKADGSKLVSRANHLRARRLHKIYCVENPDFDTASINTIFNRRDSRYEKPTDSKGQKLIFRRFLIFISRVISCLLPFNYTLPWKLLACMNSIIVVILIGCSSKTNPDPIAFTFFNGFVLGFFIAAICIILIFLSLLVKILPKSENSTYDTIKHVNSFNDSSIKNAARSDDSKERKLNKVDDVPEEKVDDFSSFEVLDSPIPPSDLESTNRSENLLDDDNYKGWMIEFVGEYALRNKSEFKLKLIYVKFENQILYLCKPKNSHEAESATFPVFIQQRCYDLNTVKNFSANLLLPKNVRNRQKWIWSKKYPIKLEFQAPFDHASKVSDTPKNIQLTLFAKSCREKEEWFRRFKRTVEENLLLANQSNKRVSIQSNLSKDSEDASIGSLKSSHMLSIRRDCVQTSRSSNILNESRKSPDDDNKMPNLEPNLIRTKSCELLHADLDLSTRTDNIDKSLDDVPRYATGCADDSTLTKETAELFSQAVEYSNFLDSRPNLNYRDYIERVIESGQDASPTSNWFNFLTGRIFFDVFSHNYWSIWFKRKIQRKLYRIRLPYFMETLTLTKIDLGTNAPQFLNVASHSFDSFGLSIDFDMAYSGGLTMTFETKLNLLKIKSDNSNSTSTSTSSSSANQTNTTNQTPVNYNITTNLYQHEHSSKETNLIKESSFDTECKENNKPSHSSSVSTRTSGESSDSDESGSDSSSDSSIGGDDVDEISDWEDYGAEKTRQNIVRFVDKIASSRYFQHATENRYIKKKLQDISNCPLVLIVKIESLNGVLTLNVPPPQTDRVWYGFKPNPELTLKALPKMGDREVNLSHVTDWIERKLAEEFRKILVIPNMEDIVLPVLKSDHLIYVTTTK